MTSAWRRPKLRKPPWQERLWQIRCGNVVSNWQLPNSRISTALR